MNSGRFLCAQPCDHIPIFGAILLLLIYCIFFNHDLILKRTWQLLNAAQDEIRSILQKDIMKIECVSATIILVLPT